MVSQKFTKVPKMWLFYAIKNNFITSKMSYRKMVKYMEKINVVNLMVESMNVDNRVLAEKAGMSAEEIDSSVAQSQQTLSFMMDNIYDKLKKENVIA